MGNFIADLLQSLKQEDELKKLSNETLSDLLLDHVWPGMDIGSPESDLIQEVINRLKKIDKKPDVCACGGKWHSIHQNEFCDTCFKLKPKP